MILETVKKVRTKSIQLIISPYKRSIYFQADTDENKENHQRFEFPDISSGEWKSILRNFYERTSPGIPNFRKLLSGDLRFTRFYSRSF